MNLILMGPPGAGKGTQGEILAGKLNIQTISTGVMLRSAIKEGTEVGKVAAQYINDGKLVPDSVIVDVVRERLSKPDVKDGFILDGFPRTVAQAKALAETGLKIDKVLCIHVADEVIVERLSSRRECSKCGAPYNVVSKPSKVEGICDSCGGELIQRADDVPETIENRLNIYHKETEPIIDFYKEMGILVVAEGQPLLEDTVKRVNAVLGLGD